MSWSFAKIGDVADVKGGKRLPTGRAVQDEKTDHPYLRVVDFGSDGLDTSSVKYITKEAHDRIKRYVIHDKDIYVSIAGTIGRVGIVPEAFSGANLTENAAKITNIKREVCNKFLLAYLRSHDGQRKMQGAAGGTSQPKLALYKLADIDFPLPDLPTQERIAGVLSAYGDLIENNRRRIALLEQAVRLLYREWFVHFRFPGSETTKFVDGLPEGWERTPFSDAAFVNYKTVWDQSKNRYIRMVPMGALSESGMTCDSSKFERRVKPTGVKFVNGDTLFARITPCLENGKTAYVDFLGEEEVACGSTEFIVFRENKISKYMIYLLAREDGFRQNAVTSMVGSSGRQRVQNSCFDKFMVSIPPEGIAAEFDLKAKPVFNQINSLQVANHKLAKARDLLLPRLMDGRLPIPE